MAMNKEFKRLCNSFFDWGKEKLDFEGCQFKNVIKIID